MSTPSKRPPGRVPSRKPPGSSSSADVKIPGAPKLPSKRPPPAVGAADPKIPGAPKMPSKRPPPPGSTPAAAPKSGRKRVLIVEDDQAIRTMLAKALGVQYEILQAENGAIGLQMASQHVPDLILTDVMMPQLDGYGLATKVRAVPALAKVPIVFLTARGGPVDVIKGIQLGARHYLIKPFQLKDVLQKIDKALEGAKSRR